MMEEEMGALATMPAPLAGDVDAHDVLGVYEEFCILSQNGTNAPHDRSAAMERVMGMVDPAHRGLVDPDIDLRWVLGQAFDVGFRRGVVFTRWLDAALADPTRRRSLIAATMLYPWLLDALPDDAAPTPTAAAAEASAA